MTNQLMEAVQDHKKTTEKNICDVQLKQMCTVQMKSISKENAKSRDKNVNEAEEDPGQHEMRETSETLIQGISPNIILDTIPEKLRLKVSECLYNQNIVEILSTNIFPHWDESQRCQAVEQVLNDDTSGVYWSILVKLFKINETIQVTRSHKKYIEKTFYRFRSIWKHLQESSVLAHDQSKFSFIELIGYTDKWVWGRNSPLWEDGLAHHYQNNTHHPQHTPGVRMTPEDLEESVVDMMACHWERKEGGGDDVTAERIGGFSDFYLERYLPQDRQIVVELLRKIRESGL